MDNTSILNWFCFIISIDYTSRLIPNLRPLHDKYINKHGPKLGALWHSKGLSFFQRFRPHNFAFELIILLITFCFFKKRLLRVIWRHSLSTGYPGLFVSKALW